MVPLQVEGGLPPKDRKFTLPGSVKNFPLPGSVKKVVAASATTLPTRAAKEINATTTLRTVMDTA
jgi:hypothetical protein